MPEHNQPQTHVDHIDTGTPHLSMTSSDGEYSAWATYQERHVDDNDDNGDKDGGNSEDKEGCDTEEEDEDILAPGEKQGREISIENPAEDVSELPHRIHLAAQLAKANRESDQYSYPDASELSDDQVANIFDEDILNLVDWALDAVDMAVDDFDIDERHIRAIILHEAWEMNSWPRLTEHLKDKTGRIIGYESVPDQSTFWKAAKKLRKNDHLQILRDAATQAVHTLFRNTVPIPDEVMQAYGLDGPAVIDERKIHRGTHRAALINWVDELLDDLLEPLSFGRDSSTEYSVRQIAGAIAQAAYANGLESARPTAAWYHAEEDIPPGYHIGRLIRGLDQNEILEIFTHINKRFIKLASERGFFQEEVDPALDTTWITWGGEGDGDDPDTALINNPKECETGKGFCLGALTLMTLDARFALGVDMAWNKDEITNQFRRLLRTLGQEGDIGRIHADREFESGDAVQMCRAVRNATWALRVRDREEDEGEIGEVMAEAEPGKPKFKESVDFAGLDQKPNLYMHPIPEHLQNQAGNTHLTLLTDLEDESELETLFETYLKRWTIETYFRQMKYRFCPPSKSPSGNLRLFLFNLGSVFYNIHTLMNRDLDPEYGLRLDPAYYDVLLGIIYSTFERSEATEVNL